MNLQSNDCLIIRNLTPQFNYVERNQLFYGVGARTVHNYPHYTIAFFVNESCCRMVIRLLHQKVLHSKRLRVEFYDLNSSTNNKHQSIRLHSHLFQDASLKQKILRDQLDFDHFEPTKFPIEDVSLEVMQLPFPRATSEIVTRIARKLLNDEQFYNLVLRLMIKLRLEPPFVGDIVDDILLEKISQNNQKNTSNHSESESEIESDNEVDFTKTNSASDYLLNNRRKRKRQKLSTGFVGDKADYVVLKRKHSDSKSSNKTTTIEEVFDSQKTLKKSSISLDIKINTPIEDSSHEVSASNIGQFGTLDTLQTPVEKPAMKVSKPSTKLFDLALLSQDELITEKEFFQNRLPESEYSENPLFSNYNSGEKSCRLYVKNLHRKTVIGDLYRIYAGFIDLKSENELNSFDVVYMEKGKMRGQAFVTFPDETRAERARSLTNGYLVHGKPIVVVFARSCKPKKKNDDQEESIG